ncbi:MAG: ATP-binding cassette domain-containing protein [Haloferacaceae archaeon]
MTRGTSDEGARPRVGKEPHPGTGGEEANGHGSREVGLERAAAGGDAPDRESRTAGEAPLVEARDVDVSLGGVRIVEGVDLAVEGGTFVGVVGPNGAGKSTLLRAMRGLLPLDGGEVRVAGVPVHERPAREVGRTIASVPQTTTLSFSFTVRETVEMGRTPHVSRFGTLKRADRRAISRAMERTDVSQFADRSITEVSGGERQRVLLARALAQETPVLFLDEPTASLDVNHAVRTLELVDDLVADGKTVIAAIHDLDLAARYCDELVLLADGRVRAAGPPAEVLTAESLGDAFDATAVVTGQPAADAPGVTALAPETSAGLSTDDRVHVLGTGRPAAVVLARLAATGAAVSVGPVHEGDDAATTADDVGAEAITVPPFAGLEEPVLDRLGEIVGAADCLVRAGEVPQVVEAVLDRLGADRMPPVVDAGGIDPSAVPGAVADRLSGKP